MPVDKPQAVSTKPKRVRGYKRGPVAKGARVPVNESTSDRALSPRVQGAIRAMVWERIKLTDAAKSVGLSQSALTQALMKPVVAAFLKQELEVFRSGARAGNLATVLEIRDDSGQPGKTRIEAARYIDGETGKPGVQVNVGVQVTPGYTVIASSPDAADVRQLLQQAGSNRTVLDHKPTDSE